MSPHRVIVLAVLVLAGCHGASDTITPATTSSPTPAASPEPAAPGFDDCGDGQLGRELAPLLGRWNGGGWIEMRPGQREEFTLIEEVSCALSGELVVMQGEGRSAAGKIVHQALGVIAPSTAGAGFQMRAYSAGRPAVDSVLTRNDDGSLDWTMSQGPVEIRFHIALADGVWRETGEASFNGSPWRQFFASKLQRAP